MEIIGVIVFVLLLLFSAVQLWVITASRRQQGKPRPDLDGLIDGETLQQERLLFYFYSERCGPCRSLTPHIDRLQREHGQVVKVDVAAQPELARRFSVLGTPTLVAVEGDVIRRVHVGAISPARLEQMIRAER